jgi:hypothetical protein
MKLPIMAGSPIKETLFSKLTVESSQPGKHMKLPIKATSPVKETLFFKLIERRETDQADCTAHEITKNGR